MSIAAMAIVFSQDIKPSSIKFVLLALADNADSDGICWPSIDKLAAKTSQDRKTVIKALDTLETQGHILDTGKRMGKTGKIKIYKINGTGNCTVETVPKTEPLNSTVLDNEIVPFFPPNSTVFGNPLEPLYRLTINEPPKEPRIREYPEEFEKLWLKWPQDRRKDKPKAYNEWKKCIKRVSPDYLEACMERYLATDKDALAGFYSYPHRWLHSENWEQFQPPAKPETEANIADVGTSPDGRALLLMFVELQKMFEPPVFRSWLAPLRVKSKDSTTITFIAPSRFTCEWIRNHYTTQITHAAGIAWPGITSITIEPKPPGIDQTT